MDSFFEMETSLLNYLTCGHLTRIRNLLKGVSLQFNLQMVKDKYASIQTILCFFSFIVFILLFHPHMIHL